MNLDSFRRAVPVRALTGASARPVDAGTLRVGKIKFFGSFRTQEDALAVVKAPTT